MNPVHVSIKHIICKGEDYEVGSFESVLGNIQTNIISTWSISV